ncbi:alpha/beta-hydrolase [Favolaschia claudopus]|uniref:triacylglycerol lipase n=1 Tax=Favolaschia claudopus TaxID=2862362 RepID=A0AAW0B6X1_9AGAR
MLLPLSLIILLLFPPALGSAPLLSPRAYGSIKARPTTVYKPRSLDAFHRARWRSMHQAETEPIEWAPQQVLGPDVEDIHTLAQLSRMAGNAYARPGKKNWYDLDEAWNISFPFGWEDHENGFRGHLFLSSDNSTVVLAIKGTTLPLNGPTSKQDKYNDNLLFSCCCSRVDFSWVFRKVCDCYRNSWRCDNNWCDSYQFACAWLTSNRRLFGCPSWNHVWASCGGLWYAIKSLFYRHLRDRSHNTEAPGERLAAHRLHLPFPHTNGSLNPFLPAVTHVFHNADPIPQGACTGFNSPCAQAGYALETRCHLGKSIVFDTVNKLGWRVDVRKHVIKNVITNVLEAEGVEWEDGRSVPLPREERNCVDCFKWDFGEFDEQDTHMPSLPL